MSEFNGRKYYGYSLHNDPALSSTSRNFEFRYARPEHTARSNPRAHQTEEAPVKQKKIMLNKYCKMKKLSKDLRSPFHSRDFDVETQLSRGDVGKVRELSENEVERLIGRAKSTIEIGMKYDRGSSGDGGDDEQLRVDYWRQFAEYEDNNGDQRMPRSYLQDLPEEPSRIFQMAKMETFRLPAPSWVEITEKPATGTLTVVDILEPTDDRTTDDDTLMLLPVTPPAPMTPYMLDNATANQMAYDDDMGDQAYYVEDSDLEYEMLGREQYTKYIQPRPKEEDLVNNSNSGGFAEFIEIESKKTSKDMSFLKNTSPIRYTELTDETVDEQPQMKVYIKPLKPQVQTKGDGKTNDKKSLKMGQSDKNDKPGKNVKTEKNDKPIKGSQKLTTKKNTSVPSQIKRPPTSPRSKTVTSPRSVNSRTPPIRSSPPYAAMRSSYAPPYLHNRLQIMSNRNLNMQRSIEELKLEKISLFTKMTNTQEVIIEILDKLRLNLLELYVPDNSFERNKRQKNAFEFSVRFSRNYLYPLKGMIDDLKLTPIDHFNSCASNEACARVSSVYSIILQALTTYHRQLRYFLLDQVPQKLTALIEMIYTTTTICLEKSVFDKNDAIIDCLLQRCSKFIGFLEDIHEERFMTMRTNYRKANFPRSHSNYDLKMFMNDLNMYEPKLVPKHSIRSRKRKSNKKEANVSHFEHSSELALPEDVDKAIRTQIENMDEAPSSYKLTSQTTSELLIKNKDKDKDKMNQTDLDEEKDRNQEKQLEPKKSCDKTLIESNPLNKAIFDALTTVTKEQVRQVLEPIIQTLGTALDKKTKSETIELIFKAFSSKKFTPAQSENQKLHVDEKYDKGFSSKVFVEEMVAMVAKKHASKVMKAAKHTKASPTNTKSQYPLASGYQQPSVNRSEADDYADDDRRGHVDGGGGGGDGDKRDCNHASGCYLASYIPPQPYFCMDDITSPPKEVSRPDEMSEMSDADTDSDDEIVPRLRASKHGRASANAKAQRKANQRTSPIDLRMQLELAQMQQEQQQIKIEEQFRKKIQKQQEDEQQGRMQNSYRKSPCYGSSNPSQPAKGGSARNSLQKSASVPAGKNQNLMITGTKKKLRKKRRNPLGPPPPVPNATPLTSARARRNELDMMELAKNTFKLKDEPIDEGLLKLLATEGHFMNKSDITGGGVLKYQRSQTTPHIPFTQNFDVPENETNMSETINPKASAKGRAKENNESDGDDQSIDGIVRSMDDEYTESYMSLHPNSSPYQPNMQKDQKRLHKEKLLEQRLQEQQEEEYIQQLEKEQIIKERQQEAKIDDTAGRPFDELAKLLQTYKDFVKTPLTKDNRKSIFDSNEDNMDRMHNQDNRLLEEKEEADKWKAVLSERDQFLMMCHTNRFYTNPTFNEPWKVFSLLSDKIVADVCSDIEKDFSIGVSKFVQDFLQLETHTLSHN